MHGFATSTRPRAHGPMIVMVLLVALLLCQALWSGVTLSALEGVRCGSLVWAPVRTFRMLSDSMFAPARVCLPALRQRFASIGVNPSSVPKSICIFRWRSKRICLHKSSPPAPPTLRAPFTWTLTQASSESNAGTQPPAETPKYGTLQPGSWAGEVGRTGRIPRLIHQTWKGDRPLDGQVAEWVGSWVKGNPEWQLRLYDDADCAAFVRNEFPEYALAYDNLVVSVQKADFFRYLVVLRYGGFYADLDTECVVPLNNYMADGLPSLVVGIENEFDSLDIALSRSYARQRQLVQWAFAAEPGHPALRRLADRVTELARSGTGHGGNEGNTLELSGPGVFTDVISQFIPPHADPSFQQAWPSAILPRVAWAANPAGFDAVLPTDAGVLLQHRFSSSWRASVRCRALFGFMAPDRGATRLLPHHAAPAAVRHSSRSAGTPTQLLGSAAEHVAAHIAAAVPRWYVPRLSGIFMSRDFWSWSKAEHYARCATRLARPRALTADERAVLYEPVAVTVPSTPSFTMLVHQKGYTVGHAPDGRDESYEISSHGMSQSGGPPSRAYLPSVHEAFLGFLSAQPSSWHLPSHTAASRRLRSTADAADASRDASDEVTPLTGAGPGATPPRAETLPGLFATPVERSPVMVDAGAGLGLTTLAAVSRGIGAVALEGDPSTVELLEGSLAELEASGTLRAPAAVLRMVPGQNRGVRCVEHHLPMGAYVSAKSGMSNAQETGEAARGPLNVVAGKGVFGAAPWYSRLVASVTRRSAPHCCGNYQLPVLRTAVDDEVAELLAVGRTIGGVRFAAKKLSHALVGAHKLLSGTLPGPVPQRLRPNGPAARNLSATGPNVTNALPRQSSDGPDEGAPLADEPQCLYTDGASPDDSLGKGVDCNTARRRVRWARSGVDGTAPPPWVLQVDVNPGALVSSFLFTDRASDLVTRIMDLGYTLRVYHWGPACQQQVAKLQRQQRLSDAQEELASRWCLARDADAVRAAVGRIPTRRTEHFVLLHRELATLSFGLMGEGALKWMETMDSVSV